MEETLIKTGLSKLQAEAYLYLLSSGSSAPKELMNKLNISRTNTYKVLESLEHLELVIRNKNNKKVMYSPADPAALSSLVAEKRNNIIALEQNINQAMQQLRNSYSKHNSTVNVTAKTGKQAMIEAYKEQSKRKQPIYFYKTRTDIPFMGFETMDKIRRWQGKETTRFGITPDAPEGPLSKEIDERTRLTRTWINDKSYTAPVEWSVSDDRLLIQVFEGNGTVLSIDNALIADAFKQIWQLSDGAIRSNPAYKSMPKKAKRLV
jgi:predicted transcriptional regulator